MPRVSNTAPPRLLNSELVKLPTRGEQPSLCVLTMDTDDGVLELALNVRGAQQLMGLLSGFLAGTGK